MKTSSKRHEKKRIEKPKNTYESNLPDEEVAVIVDLKSGAEYYMFMIDEFAIEKKSYSVMVPYEPDRIRSKDAEIVILRTRISKSGDRLYISITDKKELNAAFEIFYKRFEESGK